MSRAAAEAAAAFASDGSCMAPRHENAFFPLSFTARTRIFFHSFFLCLIVSQFSCCTCSLRFRTSRGLAPPPEHGTVAFVALVVWRCHAEKTSERRRTDSYVGNSKVVPTFFPLSFHYSIFEQGNVNTESSAAEARKENNSIFFILFSSPPLPHTHTHTHTILLPPPHERYLKMSPTHEFAGKRERGKGLNGRGADTHMHNGYSRK